MTGEGIKVLLFDTETSPSLGFFFGGLYETNIVHTVRESFMMSFSHKWLGERKVHVHALPDYPGYKKDPYNDKKLVEDLHALINEADVVIAHNGDGFDIKVANARFLVNGLPPLASKISVDTLKVARSRFKFSSNKLTDLAKFAGLGGKLETGGKGLWIDCMDGDMKAWSRMKRYNAHDVVLLEGIFRWLKPWIRNYPNMNVVNGTSYCCAHCGSSKVRKQGFKYTKSGKFQQYQCLECLAWTYGGKSLLENPVRVK